MNLIDVIREEAEHTFRTADYLFRLTDPDSLDWKPATGTNWMNMGQLLMHCTNSCGSMIKGLVTGDWGLPEGMAFEDLPPEMILPPAEKLPAVETVEHALQLLKKDRDLTHQMLDLVREEELLTKRFPPPWGGKDISLFQHLLSAVQHLNQHKGQLFYYLKLQGKPVHTGDLWGAV